MKIKNILNALIIFGFLGCGDNSETACSETISDTNETPTESQCDCNDFQMTCEDCLFDREIFVAGPYSLAELKNLDLDPKTAFELGCSYDGGFTKSWNAFVSYENSAPIDFLEKFSGKYVLPNGVTVAYDRNDLLDGSLSYPINIDFGGEIVENQNVWTGTFNNGLKSENNCKNWQNFDSLALAGNTDYLDQNWAEFTQIDCSESAFIYCIERKH